MTKKIEAWSAKHFSQANPIGASQGDVPRLLRRVATTLDKMGPIAVQDLILHTEVTGDGPWHSITVYFHRVPIAKAKMRKSREVMPQRKSS
jgi:hypothetical protein